MRILYVYGFGIFVFLLLLNLLLPMQSDDFDAYFSSQSGFEAIKQFYFHWNARIGELLHKGYLGAINPYLFDFLNAIVGVAFIISFFVLIFGKLPCNQKDGAILAFILFVFMAFCGFGGVFLWGSGSLNYLWGLLFIMIFLLPFRFYYGGGRTNIRLKPKYVSHFL